MRAIELKFSRQMIEVDDTMEFLNALLNNEEKVNCDISIVSYYLEDNINHWSENPIFTIVTSDEFYQIVNHDNDINVFDDVYDVLYKNNLIESGV